MTENTRDSPRHREETYKEMGLEVLRILNEPGDLRGSIKRVVASLKARTGFDAVGIRLQDQDDFPYLAQKGFSNDFLSTENTLIARGENGGACRDQAGRIRLACTCGLVLSGKTAAADPAFTRAGSFWTNDSSPLLDLPPGEDPRFQPRNVCIHQGYASVALVPIRNEDKIVGLIQLNDRRKGRFTLATVELMEAIASNIGSALARKRLESRLQESEEKYRGVFENGFDPVFCIDGQTHRIENVNPAALELYGYTREEFLSLKIEDISAQPERTRESVDRVSAGLAKGIVQGLRHKKKDGTDFPVEISVSRYTIDGRTKAIGAVRDISVREKAEADERYRVALLRAEQATSPDGILIVDKWGKIASHNQNFISLWGIPEKLLLAGSDRPILEFATAQCADPAAFLKRILDLYANCTESSHDVLKLKDGRTLERYSRPVLAPDSEYLGRIWFFRDVTGRNRDAKAAGETEFLRAREQMMIEMMANLSHDVRTPLAAIKGYGETLLQGGLEDAENRLDFVRTIMKHADRLSFLVEDMLLLTDLDSRAKNPSFVFQTVDLAGVVEKYVKSLSPETTPLAIDVPAALMVRADAEHLTRVFQNLIDNAVKYNRPGGSVRVEARADGASAVVTVRDTGRGIPRPELDRIFGRFYRGRATKHLHGTGLGLAIVKSIVELHGGRIWVESVFRKGSAFHFTLPLAG